MEARKMFRYASLMSVLAATFMFSGSCVAQSCNSNNQIFSPCFPAAQGTTPPLPSTACCRVMKSANGPMCLCASVANASLPDVNMQAAVMIAKHCNIFSPENTTACGTSEYPCLLNSLIPGLTEGLEKRSPISILLLMLNQQVEIVQSSTFILITSL